MNNYSVSNLTHDFGFPLCFAQGRVGENHLIRRGSSAGRVVFAYKAEAARESEKAAFSNAQLSHGSVFSIHLR